MDSVFHMNKNITCTRHVHYESTWLPGMITRIRQITCSYVKATCLVKPTGSNRWGLPLAMLSFFNYQWDCSLVLAAADILKELWAKACTKARLRADLYNVISELQDEKAHQHESIRIRCLLQNKSSSKDYQDNSCDSTSTISQLQSLNSTWKLAKISPQEVILLLKRQ